MALVVDQQELEEALQILKESGKKYICLSCKETKDDIGCHCDDDE